MRETFAIENRLGAPAFWRFIIKSLLLRSPISARPNLFHQNRRPKPRYIQKIIDKIVRYLLHNRNNLFVFLSQEYMFICSQ